VVQARQVSKSYGALRVLDGVDLEIRRGEMVALIGASGSGKSTLIRAIAGLSAIDHARDRKGGGKAGEILLFAKPMQQSGRIGRAATALRARVGVIFQQFNLVPRLSVLTNVCLGRLGQMPLWRASLGRFSAADKRRAMQALARVGIAQHALKRGCDLSGGQQQRAAIARTLVQGAEFIVADEPIASLDPHSTRRVMDILADLNRRDGITVLVSLHQVEYALRYCGRVVALKEGAVVYDGPAEALSPETLAAIYGAESDELFASLESLAAPQSAEARRRDAARAAPNSEAAVRLEFARRPIDQRHTAHG